MCSQDRQQEICWQYYIADRPWLYPFNRKADLSYIAYLCPLTLTTREVCADDRSNVSQNMSKFVEILNFINIFVFTVRNAFK